MKQVFKKVVTLALASMVIFVVKAQDEKRVALNVSGEVVSSYVWRGAYNAGASVQPVLGLEAGIFSFTAWGSKEISGPHKEVDLAAAYNSGKWGVAVTDYWWDGERYDKSGNPAYAKNNKYFHFDNHTTSHYVEAALNYMISDRLPLSVAWYTMVWGADKKSDGEQNYSSYVELNYPFKLKDIALNATLGFSPYDSNLYGVSSFGVCNLGIGATKEIKCSQWFSLPAFTRLIFDPAHEDVHMVFGFTMR